MSAFSHLVELNSRTDAGIEVTLLWDRNSGEVFIAVCDLRQDSESVIAVAPENAADAFQHPFAYLTAQQGNSYPVAA